MSWVSDELAALEGADLLRRPRTLDSAQDPQVSIDGRDLVLLCSNNYLGLASDVRVREAAASAARRWGAGSGASRLVSGTSRPHRDLEASLAAFENTEDAVLFSSGYLANLGVITTLAGDGDVVFSDELNHASIVDACRLAKAPCVVYRHADDGHLEELLRSTSARRKLVVTDTIFSMDGDLAPLAAIATLCERYDATLVVDEAHATGVLGPRGAGAVDELGLDGRVPVIVGTLSKALGSAGGYVAARRDVSALLRNRARTHVFDTASAPPAVAAAAEALRIVGAEPWRRERVRDLAHSFARTLRSLGYDASDPAAAVISVVVGEPRDAVELSDSLFDRGVFCPAIRPPSVADGTSRLRVTLMATHTDDHIARALDAFAAARGVRHMSGPGPADDPLDVILRAGGVFVTGTDTGVGKTIVTAAIARCLRDGGLATAIFKPVQTGTIDGVDDAAYAARLAGVDGESTVALLEPLAPSVAAAVQGEAIDVDALVARAEELRERFDAVVVEGAGGLIVPIDDRHTMGELAARMRLPVVIVARPGLGTLNHTALTVEAARARGLDVLGIVLSGWPAQPSLAERTNPSELMRLCACELIGVVGLLADLDTERGRMPSDFRPSDWLGPRLGGSFDLGAFLQVTTPSGVALT